MNAERANHASYLLADGRIVLAGGFQAVPQGGNMVRVGSQTVDIYHPGTNTYEAAEELLVPRLDAVHAVLPDGRLLVAGGTPAVGGAALPSAELFTPAQ
jgi:hypothetical protein